MRITSKSLSANPKETQLLVVEKNDSYLFCFFFYASVEVNGVKCEHRNDNHEQVVECIETYRKETQLLVVEKNDLYFCFCPRRNLQFRGGL